MDNKKDIFYKTNGLVERQEGGGIVGGATSENTNSSFNGDVPENIQTSNFSNFLNKKIERLATALYMVTSFLSDREPIKWNLRDRNIVLLSGINNAHGNTSSEVENIFADYSHTIDEIISMLEISVASKLISEMNFSILKNEYTSLKTTIDSREHLKAKTGKFTFSTDFFRQKDTQIGEVKDINKKDKSEIRKENNYNESRASIKDIDKGQALLQKMSFVSKRQKEDVQFSNETTVRKNVALSRSTAQGIKKNKTDRKSSILKLFKKGKELTIKDISCDMFGCSEKTIQRELLSLVADGLLNKKGERRWSRYSLK